MTKLFIVHYGTRITDIGALNKELAEGWEIIPKEEHFLGDSIIYKLFKAKE